MRTAKLNIVILTICALLLPAALFAQQTSPIEVGGATTVLVNNRIGTATDAGLVGRFTYNFTPSFSIDSEVGSYLTNTNPAASQYQFGGRAFLALVGPKAGFRTRHVDVFLKIRPGILSYGSTLKDVESLNPPLVRKTDAVLDVGTTVEFRTSTRTFVRIDAGELLVRYGDALIFQSPPGPVTLSVGTIGYIGSPWHLEFGVGYRVGALREQTEISPTPSRFTAGAQYSLLTLVRSSNVVRDESSVGGFFTWDFSKYVGFDSSLLFFPRDMKFADFQQGGRMLQAFGGIRVGVRRGHFGIYAKIRPGTQLFTLTSGNLETQIENGTGYTPYADLALDAGGIIEYYATRRTTLRLDAGQTWLYYPARNVIDQNGQPFHASAFSATAMQVSLGLGFRFGFPSASHAAQ